MKAFRSLIAILLAILLLSCSAFALSDCEKYKTSVVQISASHYNGTGFFVTDNLIVTSAHLLTNSIGEYKTKAQYRIKGWYWEKCEVVAWDKENDLCLLYARNPKCYMIHGVPLAIGSETSGELSIVGFPKSTYSSVTAKLTGRTSTTAYNGFGIKFEYKDVLKLDNSTAVGGSGSPVFNKDGEVIGIYACRNTQTNEGYSVDVSHLVKLLETIKKLEV